jgi:histidinol dehydrogenase
MSTLRILNSQDADFEQQLNILLARDTEQNDTVQQTVAGILADVRQRGDKAVLEYTRRFDGLDIKNAAGLVLPKSRLQSALNGLHASEREALEIAAVRIQRYAEHQKLQAWSYIDEHGNRLGQHITPLQRVGLYVPGGKAAYPSSVLMNAIPAKVAGVDELVMVVPTPKGEVNLLVLAAAALAGVDKVLTIGGAQAVAALAYGTQSIPKVDKIVGPGNIYVATAKQQVFGTVGIDMIAGPSEVVVVSDGHSDPDWVAMDLFSQAEHDELAQSILISPNKDFIGLVKNSIVRLLPDMSRRDIIAQSLKQRGALIQVISLDEAIDVVNRIAPEHLELSYDGAADSVVKIKNAGAIFVGRYAAEVLGDYVAGPNHVLPTSGTARFASPLGVYDFQKRSSIIDCSAEGAAALAGTASVLARGEGLDAHARSAEFRLPEKTS